MFVHGGIGDWQAWAPQWSEFAANTAASATAVDSKAFERIKRARVLV